MANFMCIYDGGSDVLVNIDNTFTINKEDYDYSCIVFTDTDNREKLNVFDTEEERDEEFERLKTLLNFVSITDQNRGEYLLNPKNISSIFEGVNSDYGIIVNGLIHKKGFKLKSLQERVDTFNYIKKMLLPDAGKTTKEVA